MNKVLQIVWLCVVLFFLLPSFALAKDNCTFLCTKGNYNKAWRKNLCLSGKNPGVDHIWFDEYYTYNGVVWDSMGSGQDHKGTCVSTYPEDRGNSNTNRILFHDGCSAYPNGNPRKMTIGANRGWDPDNWGQVFHSACVMHDLCFKAEPNFSNRTKKQCDDQIKIYAREICYASYQEINGFLGANDLEKCLQKANNARFWSQFGGGAQYEAFNISPTINWQPKGGLCPDGYHYDVVRNDCVYTSLCPNPTVHYFDMHHDDGKVICRKIYQTPVTSQQCYQYQGTVWQTILASRCLWDFGNFYESALLK